MEHVKKFLRACAPVLYYFGLILLSEVILFGIFGIESEDDSRFMPVFLAASFIGCAYVVFKNRKELKEQFKDFKKNLKNYSATAFKNWLMGYFLMIAANLIIVGLLKGVSANEQAARDMIGISLFYTGIYTCFLAPLSEEILFRMNFKGVFKDDKTFLWGTSLMFGAMHVVSPSMTFSSLLYIFPYMILGYFFGKAYIETDNIYSGILAHMTQNILSLMIILFLT